MNKICIIAPANLKFVPYVQYYLSFLESNNYAFEIISWNKANLDENVEYRMNFFVEDLDRFKMLIGYLKFGHFCRKILRKGHYDKIIFLTIAPLFFCGTKVSKKNKGKYILDIRDASPLTRAFPRTFQKLLNNSFAVVSSSWMFSSWINHSFILCHNVDINYLKKHLNDSVVESTGEKKRIVFAGMMIEEKINIKVLECFKNNDNLSFLFIGRDNPGKQKIVEHVRSCKIKNVAFEGTFNKDDIVNIYRTKADFVNIFRENTDVNKNAIPNKFYDAIVSGVPLLVFNHNEGIAEITKKFNLGIVLKEEDLLSLEDLLNCFDYQRFAVGRKQFLDIIIQDDDNFKKTLSHFISIQDNCK